MDRRIRTAMSNTIPKDCGSSGYTRNIHDPSVWRYLQDVYIDTADEVYADRYENRRDAFPSYSGFVVDVEVKDKGHRGRSVYAAEPIKKGTAVWKPTHLVKFYTPREMRGFLQKLDYDLQCDALLWAYVEKGEDFVALALDPASFVNHGETEDVINLDGNCVALRDIPMGEELLENYTHFIGFDQEEVEWFHTIRGISWAEDDSANAAESTNEYNLLGAPKQMLGSIRGSAPLPSAPVMAFFVSCLVAIFVLRRFLPSNVFKKQKGGI